MILLKKKISININIPFKINLLNQVKRKNIIQRIVHILHGYEVVLVARMNEVWEILFQIF